MNKPIWTLALLLLGVALAAQASEYRELEWLELMPEEEAEAWLNGQQTIEHSGGMPINTFQSDLTVPELDGERFRLPGFVVPVETTENGQLLEFFLVPYFGACIHVPPPPQNQIIYGRLEEPIDMVNIWDAFWLEGTLNIENVSNSTADASYTADVDRLVLY